MEPDILTFNQQSEIDQTGKWLHS